MNWASFATATCHNWCIFETRPIVIEKGNEKDELLTCVASSHDFRTARLKRCCKSSGLSSMQHAGHCSQLHRKYAVGAPWCHPAIRQHETWWEGGVKESGEYGDRDYGHDVISWIEWEGIKLHPGLILARSFDMLFFFFGEMLCSNVALLKLEQMRGLEKKKETPPCGQIISIS